jgi:TonB family protein
MKIVTVVMLALFLAVDLCAQQAPDGKPASAARSSPQNSSTTGIARYGAIEVLSDTQGVDFSPYLSHVIDAVRSNWLTLIPTQAKAPESKSGNVLIEFAILSDGHVKGMRLVHPSGDVALDRAAWGGITASNPFAPLPAEYKAPYLALRFRFQYNPTKAATDGPTESVNGESQPL